jgi:hypothetical protein
MFYSTHVILQMTDVIGEYAIIEKDLHEWTGPVGRLCGPTTAETGLQSQSQSMANTLQSSYSTLFGQQQGTLANLNSSVAKIATGQTGPGFGAQEENANVAGIQNNAEAAAKNADQATQDYLSGQGSGGGNGIRSGVAGELKQQASTGAANEESTALNENTRANYQQGRINDQASIAGYANLAGEESPNAAAQGEISSNQNSFGQADVIQQQKNALGKDIAGGITSLAGAALTGGMSGLFGSDGGGSSVDQVMQESQGDNSDNYIQQPYAPTVSPAMAFPG